MTHSDQLLPDVLSGMDTAPGITEAEMLTTALLVLVEFGIEPDIQELLIYGNPARRVRPGALKAAMRAVASHTRQATPAPDEMAEAIELLRSVSGIDVDPDDFNRAAAFIVRHTGEKCHGR